MTIRESPLRDRTRLQVMVPSKNPTVLDLSWLGGPMKLGSAGAARVWTDYVGEATQIEVRRGGRREGVTVINELGTLTATFKGLEVTSSDSPFIADMPLRLLAYSNGQWLPVFTGEIRDITIERIPLPNGRLETFTTVTAVDAVASHDEITRYGAMPPSGFETFRDRISRLRSSAKRSVALPSNADFTSPFGETLQLGRTVFESSLSNHFTLAANSVRGFWFVDASGVTRFRRLEVDPGNYVYMSEGTYLSEIPDSGTSAQITTVVQRIRGAEPDPDRPGEWIATEREIIAPDTPVGAREAIGDRRALIEVVATQQYPDFAWMSSIWSSYAFRWATMIAGIRLNAQQLGRYALELGTTLYLPRPSAGPDAAGFFLVIGIRHTITPTRWITQLDLMGG